MMRKVKYYEYEHVENNKQWERKLKGEGIFHEFGVDFMESEYGYGNFSTAIIELSDGSIINIPVENIEFIKE
jgi:hypothetical protein